MSETPKTTPEFNATKSNFGTRGWIFVIYSFLVMLVNSFIGDSMNNLALPALCEQFGWDYANVLTWNTVFSWITIAFFFFFGSVLRKFSPKKGVIIVGVLYLIATLVVPSSKLAWEYVASRGLIIICGNTWYNQFNAIITANWFPRKKGLVIGWTTMGLPLGAAFGTKIYYTIMPMVGMAGVYYIYDGLMLVALLLCIFFVTDYPEQCGCFPDNDKSMTTEEAQRIMKEGIALSEKTIWTNGRLLKTKEVWLLGLSLGIQMLFASGFMGVMVPRMMALGYQPGQAVNFMMFAGIMGGIGSYVVGWLDQKTNPKTATILVHAAALASCALNIIPNTICVIISLILLGLVLGGAANNLMSIISTMWGRYGFKRAHTIILVINQIIGSAGAALVSQIAKRYSYTGSYIVVGCLAIVGICLILPVKLDSIKNYEIEAGQDLAVR